MPQPETDSPKWPLGPDWLPEGFAWEPRTEGAVRVRGDGLVAEIGTGGAEEEFLAFRVRLDGQARSEYGPQTTRLPSNSPPLLRQAGLAALTWGMLAYRRRFGHLDEHDLQLLARLRPGDRPLTDLFEEHATPEQLRDAFRWLLQHHPVRADQWLDRMPENRVQTLKHSGLLDGLQGRLEEEKRQRTTRTTTSTPSNP